MPVDFSKLILGIKYTRPQLAIIWNYNKHQGFSKGVFTPSGQNVIVIFVTRIKQESLTQYNDYISGDVLHWEGETEHRNDNRIANAHLNGDEIHLFYREIHHTPFEYRGKIQILNFIEKIYEPSSFNFQLNNDLGISDDIQTHKMEFEFLTPTERQAIVQARIGQGRFRESLLDIWKGCAVTGVNHPGLLKASHIKPWRYCSNDERTNPENGLPLLAQYDHLFDKGFISFQNNGKILISKVLEFFPSEKIGISESDKLKNNINTDFLEYHRQEIFINK